MHIVGTARLHYQGQDYTFSLNSPKPPVYKKRMMA